jgi:hypothetical protein
VPDSTSNKLKGNVGYASTWNEFQRPLAASCTKNALIKSRTKSTFSSSTFFQNEKKNNQPPRSLLRKDPAFLHDGTSSSALVSSTGSRGLKLGTWQRNQKSIIIRYQIPGQHLGTLSRSYRFGDGLGFFGNFANCRRLVRLRSKDAQGVSVGPVLPFCSRQEDPRDSH